MQMPTVKVELDEVEEQCNRIIMKMERIQMLQCEIQAMVLGENYNSMPAMTPYATNEEEACRLADLRK